MSASLSIESVKLDFERWRAQKKSPQCRAPDHLRQKALALRAQHSEKDIIKALSISRERLASWDVDSTTPSIESKSRPAVDTDFVPLTLDMPVSLHSELNLTCEQANGSRWQLQGPFTAEQLSAFVCALKGQTGGRL